MKVKQIYDLVNTAAKSTLGENAVIVQEDLSNLVDVGTALFNANALDNYVKTLVDAIGKVIFVNRPYEGSAPKVLMDGWEFGSVLEKVKGDLPEATENKSWELENGTSYDPNVFTKPTVSVKFFNSKTTFEVPVSITQLQVKESFTSAEQMNAFISMIYSNVEKAMTVALDNLVMRTIDNMIGETIHDSYASGSTSASSTVRAVNLLYKYNQIYGTSLTADKCLETPEFIRFASLQMSLYIKRLKTMSSLFNCGRQKRFTPSDLLHVVILDEFDAASKAYLQSDTYHKELVALPNAETVICWQGTGENFNFEDTSKINIKLASDNSVAVEQSGILAVMFDRDALGVTNFNRRTTTNYNPRAEFYNEWFKQDAAYFNDLDENFVVFFVA